MSACIGVMRSPVTGAIISTFTPRARQYHASALCMHNGTLVIAGPASACIVLACGW